MLRLFVSMFLSVCLLVPLLLIADVASACDGPLGGFKRNGHCLVWLEKPKAFKQKWASTKRKEKMVQAKNEWHRCEGKKPGAANCGSQSMQTGKGKCVSHSFSAGFDYELPKMPVGGLKFKTAWSKGYSTCATQSISRKCTPKPKYEIRPVISLVKRDAWIDFKGMVKIKNWNKGWCPKGFTKKFMGSCGPRGCSSGAHTICKKFTTATRRGYWPEYKVSDCKPRKIGSF
jgi:hypothetical protein